MDGTWLALGGIVATATLGAVRRGSRAGELARSVIILDRLGDADPIENDGGVLFHQRVSIASPAGYSGSNEPWIEYVYANREPDGRLRLFTVPLPVDVMDWYDWVDWDRFGEEIDYEELERWSVSEDPVERAAMVELIGSTYGWHELDSYPQKITPEHLIARWRLDE